MLQAIDTEGHIHSEGHVANLPLLYCFLFYWSTFCVTGLSQLSHFTSSPYSLQVTLQTCNKCLTLRGVIVQDNLLGFSWIQNEGIPWYHSTLHTYGIVSVTHKKKITTTVVICIALASGLKACQDDKMLFSELKPKVTNLTFSIQGCG